MIKEYELQISNKNTGAWMRRVIQSSSKGEAMKEARKIFNGRKDLTILAFEASMFPTLSAEDNNVI